MTDDHTLEPDLVETSLLRPLFQLLASFDRDILALYDDWTGDPSSPATQGFRSHFAGPLIQLGRRGPLSIRQLADAAEVSHSAMSQTVAAMRRAGFVADARPKDGADARTHAVRATPKASRLTPYLEAEWRATESALRELDAELPHPLTEVVAQVQAAVRRRPFADRLRAHLVPPDPPPDPPRATRRG